MLRHGSARACHASITSASACVQCWACQVEVNNTPVTLLKKGRELVSACIECCVCQVEVNNMPVTMLKKGSYFGEVGLLRSTRRSACVRAVSSICELFVLSKVSPQLLSFS